MSINWTHAPYVSNSDIVDGYPVIAATPDVEEFDITKVWSAFQQDGTVYSYYHPKNVLSVFDLSKVYSTFDVLNKSLYGYAVPFVPSLPKPGAFAGTTGIQTITLPMSVECLGRYTFSDSSLSSIALSPVCEFYSSTFPQNCAKTFYNCSITSVVYPVDPIEFTVGDNYTRVLSGTIVNVRVTDNNENFDTVCRHFDFSGIDTSQVVSDASATLTAYNYDGGIIGTSSLTYSVVAS